MVVGAGGPVYPGGRPDGARAAQWLSTSVRSSRVTASDVAAGSQRNGRRYTCINRRHSR